MHPSAESRSYGNSYFQEKPVPAKRTRTLNSLPIVRVRHPQSSKNGIIMFLGEEKGGKSSTINCLFGNGKEISPISHEIGTTEILELRSTEPVKNLRVIDVPGLGAANSLEWDAQILATLKKYMDVDEDLSRSIPHMVVLVSRFDRPENSLYNQNSRFSKTLNALNLLKARILDKYNPNLVVVLTRFMSGKRRYRVIPQPYVEKIKQLVRHHLDLSYDPYVVLAENEAHLWNLNRVADSFQLSNGDYYPANLMDAIMTVSKLSKSLIGFEYFRQIMELRKSLRFYSPTAIPMVDPDRKRFKKFYQALELQLTKSTEL